MKNGGPDRPRTVIAEPMNVPPSGIGLKRASNFGIQERASISVGNTIEIKLKEFSQFPGTSDRWNSNEVTSPFFAMFHRQCNSYIKC